MYVCMYECIYGECCLWLQMALKQRKEKKETSKGD